MSNYELIAFDMDGTLLNSKKQIPQESIDMIEKAVLAGKTVCLSTGRCLPELTIFENQLANVRYFICISGALIYDNQTKQILSSSQIPKEIAFQLFNRVKNEDLMINYFCQESVIEKDKIERMADFQMGIYQDIFKKVTHQVDNIFEHYKQALEPLFKINLYSKTPEQREILLPKINDIDLTFAYSEVTSIECSAKGVSKASGLKLLCEKLNIPMEKTIAVGDADNDIEILKAAGLSIAMGNANEKVRNLAKVIVNDNDHGGCVQAIQDHLLK